jgi:hypothetical protein
MAFSEKTLHRPGRRKLARLRRDLEFTSDRLRVFLGTVPTEQLRQMLYALQHGARVAGEVAGWIDSDCVRCAGDKFNAEVLFEGEALCWKCVAAAQGDKWLSSA